jgi:hypothetical protein
VQPAARTSSNCSLVSIPSAVDDGPARDLAASEPLPRRPRSRRLFYRRQGLGLGAGLGAGAGAGLDLIFGAGLSTVFGAGLTRTPVRQRIECVKLGPTHEEP